MSSGGTWRGMAVVVVWAIGCGQAGPTASTSRGDAAGGIDARGGGTPDARRAADARRADAPVAIGGDGGVRETDGGGGATGTYRTSLAVCWTDPRCDRAFAIGHGGMWDALSAPYDSDAALDAARDGDMDGVKVDVRIAADGVPVIAHSSPIELYESLDCAGRVIEEMTSAEVTACHRVPSSTETFQRLDDVLARARGFLVVQLTVKRVDDYAGVIAAVLEQHAQAFVFFEIKTAELQTIIPSIPRSDEVYYLINVGASLGEIDVLLDTIANPRAFMVELDPSPQVASLVAKRLHPAGVRAFTYDRSATASVDELVALYDQGFDVVSAQAAANAVAARVRVNTARAITPP